MKIILGKETVRLFGGMGVECGMMNLIWVDEGLEYTTDVISLQHFEHFVAQKLYLYP